MAAVQAAGLPGTVLGDDEDLGLAAIVPGGGPRLAGTQCTQTAARIGHLVMGPGTPNSHMKGAANGREKYALKGHDLFLAELDELLQRHCTRLGEYLDGRMEARHRQCLAQFSTRSQPVAPGRAVSAEGFAFGKANHASSMLASPAVDGHLQNTKGQSTEALAPTDVQLPPAVPLMCMETLSLHSSQECSPSGRARGSSFLRPPEAGMAMHKSSSEPSLNKPAWQSSTPTSAAPDGSADRTLDQAMREPPAQRRASDVSMRLSVRSNRGSGDLTFEEADQERLARSRRTAAEVARYWAKKHKSDLSRRNKGPMIQRRIRQAVESQWFNAITTLLVLSNVLFFGFEVQSLMGKSDQDIPVGFKVGEYLYTLFFCAELALRVVALGPRRFFLGSQVTWNWVDSILVLVSLVEVLVDIITLGNVSNSGKLTYARIVRIARATRVFRIVRLMNLFKPLRILVSTVGDTIRSLLWVAVLLTMLIYIFSMAFSLMSSQAMASNTTGIPLPLEDHFGSLWMTMLTLLQAITGGIDWDNALKSLRSESALWSVLFVFYVTLCHLAILNVVTGVVVHIAIESAKHDQDIVVQTHLEMKQKYVRKLNSIFQDVGGARSDGITLQEFEDRLQDPSLKAYFGALDLTTDQAWGLFKLLDVHGTSMIDVDEFVSGCLKLRGTARSFDMHMLLYESRWVMKKLGRIGELLEEVNGHAMNASLRSCPPSGTVSLSGLCAFVPPRRTEGAFA